MLQTSRDQRVREIGEFDELIKNSIKLTQSNESQIHAFKSLMNTWDFLVDGIEHVSVELISNDNVPCISPSTEELKPYLELLLFSLSQEPGATRERIQRVILDATNPPEEVVRLNDALDLALAEGIVCKLKGSGRTRYSLKPDADAFNANYLRKKSIID